MARNKVEDTPFDVAQRFVDPKKMVKEQQTSIMTKIRESLWLLTLHLDQRPGRVEEDRAVGVAQRRPLNQVRESAVGFVQRQPGNQIVVGRRPTNHVDNEEESEVEAKESPIIPSFNAYCHLENFVNWFSKVDKFFAFYTGIPKEKEVKYVARKLHGYASRWWEQLQANRRREFKQLIRTWHKMRQLMSIKFLQANHGQMLYQEYQRKLASKRLSRDTLDLPCSVPSNNYYVFADIENL